jgi:ribonuclease BN (tRNA processing enzyme)
LEQEEQMRMGFQDLRGFATAIICALCATCFAQTRVITLGTQGGPGPSLTRSQAANAVVVGDRVYLVDAGAGVARQLTAAGIDYRRATRIFITHNHDDHNADWGGLMGLQWDARTTAETHVHGPHGTESMLHGYLQYLAPNVRIRQADAARPVAPEQILRAHDYTAGTIYSDDLVTVTAIENCHYAPNAQRDPADKSYALKFTTRDKVIVFSGDTGPCRILTEFARGADLLLHEVIDLALIETMLRRAVPAQTADAMMRHMIEEHTSAEDVGRLAAAAGVKQLVLTHVIPGGDEPDEGYTAAVRRHYKGPVTVARDLMGF